MVRTRMSLASVLLASVSLSACDIPTSVPKAPIYDTAWNLPASNTSIAVAKLLPSDGSIKVDSTQTTFLLTVNPVSITRQLGQDCAACAAGTGTTIPKPPFSTTASVSNALPAKLVTAVLANDTLTLTMTNNYTFDPLKPAGAFATESAGNCWNNQSTGFMVTTLTSGGVSIGKDSVNGATQTFAANGGVLIRKIALSGNVAQSTGIQVSSTICSPPGGPVAMDASKTFAINASTGSKFGVSQASVLVTTQAITAASDTLPSLDSTIAGHIKSGRILLTVTNPFSVSGALSATVTDSTNKPLITSTGAAVAAKSVNIASTASAFTDTVAFSGPELQAMFARKSLLSIAGSVSQVGASVTVHPADVITVKTRVDVIISTTCQTSNGSC